MPHVMRVLLHTRILQGYQPRSLGESETTGGLLFAADKNMFFCLRHPYHGIFCQDQDTDRNCQDVRRRATTP